MRALSRGFMVVDNSLTDSLYNSNRVLDERDADDDEGTHHRHVRRDPVRRMGNGCSGGSIQQNTASHRSTRACSTACRSACDSPDSDDDGDSRCRLRAAGQRVLKAPSDRADRRPDADADQRQEGGDQRSPRPDRLPVVEQRVRFRQQAWQLRASVIVDQTPTATSPDVGAPRNNCELPAALVYDAANNPSGTRCTDADAAVQVWGTASGTTRRADLTYDNVGVQYGLKAFKAGSITAEEFVTLNEVIGGTDPDNNLDRGAQSRRMRRPCRSPTAPASSSNGTNLGQGRDHRPARLRRAGHPLPLAELLGA